MSCRAAQVYLGGGLELTVYRDGRAAIEAGCTLECGRCYYRSDCFHRLEVKEPDRAWHLVAAFWPQLSAREREAVREVFDGALRGRQPTR
ncbi:hypothetical protein HRbin25_00542 [bacterium HR25]|nr:hypothetical protein HRbin25_00542 [bacterium HR25]